MVSKNDIWIILLYYHFTCSSQWTTKQGLIMSQNTMSTLNNIVTWNDDSKQKYYDIHTVSLQSIIGTPGYISNPVLSVYSDKREGLFKLPTSLILLEWPQWFPVDNLSILFFIFQELCGHWTWEDNFWIGNALRYLINFNLKK